VKGSGLGCQFLLCDFCGGGGAGGLCNTFSSIQPLMMADSEAKGAEFEKKADKKMSGWAVFGSKYDDAAELLEKAGNSYKLAKSCNAIFLDRSRMCSNNPDLFSHLSILFRFDSDHIIRVWRRSQ
jgi:hypothetical protein